MMKESRYSIYVPRQKFSYVPQVLDSVYGVTPKQMPGVVKSKHRRLHSSSSLPKLNDDDEIYGFVDMKVEIKKKSRNIQDKR